MKRRIVSLLLAAVMVLSMIGSAWATESGERIAAETQVRNGELTLTITARESTTNGKISISFNTTHLRYENAASDAAVFSAKAGDGVITVGYAVSSAGALEAGDTIAVLRFASRNGWMRTKLNVTLENFNGVTAANEALAELEVVRILNDYTGPDSGTEPTPDTTPTPDTDAEPEISFGDVAAGDWYYAAVNHVVSKGYFKGVSTTSFAPNDGMNRAMFVTVLGRMASVNDGAYSNRSFGDLQKNAYYEGFVVWAAENGIVQGTSDASFSPDAPVTREQMAVFLYRYAKYLGMDVSLKGTAQLTGYADASSVSSWAVVAMQWAVTHGIITGTDKGLEPTATATRAQVAQIIYRFANLIEK